MGSSFTLLLALEGPERGQGSGAWPSVLGGAWHEGLSSLPDSPHAPTFGQNELTGKAPLVPMGESSHTAYRPAQHRHCLHHPLIRWGAQK